MTKLQQTILNIVEASQGIKGATLEAQLSTNFLTMDMKEIENVIEGMIIDGEIVEVQYKIPDYGLKSFILPKGTHVGS